VHRLLVLVTWSVVYDGVLYHTDGGNDTLLIDSTLSSRHIVLQMVKRITKTNYYIKLSLEV
jgi:hypothetical protein